MLNLQKVLIAVTLSIASLLFGLLIPALTKSASETRSLDGLVDALGYGFLAFIIGLVISIFLIIKVPERKIKSVLYVSTSIFVVGIVIAILGNLNNWWR